MKKKFFLSFGTALIVQVLFFFATPTPAHAQDFSSVLLTVQDLINQVIPLLIGVAVALFLWGLATFMGATENAEKQKAARGRMVFGIIILAVMIGIWGLVNIIVYTFDLDVLSPPSVEAPSGSDIGSSSGGIFGPGPGGLVPCGQEENFCTACDIYKLIHNVINFLVFLSVPFAVLSIAIGGVYILFGAGLNQSWISTGRSYISTALFGLLIVLVSWIVINTIISYLANPAAFDFIPWNQIQC